MLITAIYSHIAHFNPVVALSMFSFGFTQFALFGTSNGLYKCHPCGNPFGYGFPPIPEQICDQLWRVGYW